MEISMNGNCWRVGWGIFLSKECGRAGLTLGLSDGPKKKLLICCGECFETWRKLGVRKTLF